jgi:hypothetical protein
MNVKLIFLVVAVMAAILTAASLRYKSMGGFPGESCTDVTSEGVVSYPPGCNVPSTIVYYRGLPFTYWVDSSETQPVTIYYDKLTLDYVIWYAFSLITFMSIMRWRRRGRM